MCAANGYSGTGRKSGREYGIADGGRRRKKGRRIGEGSKRRREDGGAKGGLKGEMRKGSIDRIFRRANGNIDNRYLLHIRIMEPRARTTRCALGIFPPARALVCLLYLSLSLSLTAKQRPINATRKTDSRRVRSPTVSRRLSLVCILRPLNTPRSIEPEEEGESVSSGMFAGVVGIKGEVLSGVGRKGCLYDARARALGMIISRFLSCSYKKKE